MTTIQERLAAANPSNPPERAKEERVRIPMSLPHQKLSVPEIPGYFCYWMLGRPDRIQQAFNAGYVFVDRDEVDANTFGLADGQDSDGSTDLGSRVSIVSGVTEEGTMAQRLYLMKLPLKYREEDLAAQAAQQEAIAAKLRGDKSFTEGPEGGRPADADFSNRYSRNAQANMFIPKRNRRPNG